MTNRFTDTDRAQRLTWYNEARTAGMTPTRAARWATYRQHKADRGEQPITLTQAVPTGTANRDG